MESVFRCFIIFFVNQKYSQLLHTHTYITNKYVLQLPKKSIWRKIKRTSPWRQRKFLETEDVIQVASEHIKKEENIKTAIFRQLFSS